MSEESLIFASAMIHESSYVDDNVSIGKNTKIWHFCHIIQGTKIGDNCSIGQNVVIGGNVRVGHGCKIQNNVSVYEGVELEDDVFCGPSVVFTNVITPRSHVSRKNQYQKTVIRKRASLGANATIVCGNEIGEYCLVGAGAVITKDVPRQALMVGNPAKQIGWVCMCGGRLDKALICEYCDASYIEKNRQLTLCK